MNRLRILLSLHAHRAGRVNLQPRGYGAVFAMGREAAFEKEPSYG